MDNNVDDKLNKILGQLKHFSIDKHKINKIKIAIITNESAMWIANEVCDIMDIPKRENRSNIIKAINPPLNRREEKKLKNRKTWKTETSLFIQLQKSTQRIMTLGILLEVTRKQLASQKENTLRG